MVVDNLYNWFRNSRIIKYNSLITPMRKIRYSKKRIEEASQIEQIKLIKIAIGIVVILTIIKLTHH